MGKDVELCKNKFTLPKREISATIGRPRKYWITVRTYFAFRLTHSPLAEVDGTKIEILVDSGATISCLLYWKCVHTHLTRDHDWGCLWYPSSGAFMSHWDMFQWQGQMFNMLSPKMSAMRPLIECYCAAAVDASAEYDNLSSFSLQTQFNLACENDWIVGPEGCVLPIQLT